MILIFFFFGVEVALDGFGWGGEVRGGVDKLSFNFSKNLGGAGYEKMKK